MAEPQKAPVPLGEDGDDELGLIEVRLEHRGTRVTATGMADALARLVAALGEEGAAVNGIPSVPPAPPAPPAAPAADAK